MQETQPEFSTFDLSEDYPLEQDQVASFQQNGYILLRQVATPSEMAVYRPVIRDATYRYNIEKRPLAERTTYGKAFL